MIIMDLAAAHRPPMEKPAWVKTTRFPGICQHAEQLGVTRVHLYLVLSGQRESVSLRRRYQELTEKGKA